MTSEKITPNVDGWLADLRCQQKQAGRAAVLLEHAVETLHAEQPNEERTVKAQRLRGVAVVAQTAALGISILFVEQNVHAALSIAHRGYVLANGRVVLGGSAAELGQSKLVQEAFLARRKGEPRPAQAIGGRQ